MIMAITNTILRILFLMVKGRVIDG